MSDDIFKDYFGKGEPEKTVLNSDLSDFILTASNYHSQLANQLYMGVSQYKSWMECEANTLHWLNSGAVEEDTDAFMVGKYVHKFSEGPEALERFKAANRDYIYNNKGKPYASFIKADEMINVLASDPKVMFYLQGNKEVILIAELFGCQWKIMIDIDNDQLNYLADLKTTKSISEWGWVWSLEENRNIKVSFIEEWKYMIQAAVYSEVERIARGRETYKDFHIIAVSKEKTPDHAIIDLTDPVRRESELQQIAANMPRILQVKAGIITPARCEHCNYCRATKKVDKIVHYTELREAW